MALSLSSSRRFICHQTKKNEAVLVKAMDCGIVVREFIPQSHYYDHFLANTLGKDMNPLILPAMG